MTHTFTPKKKKKKLTDNMISAIIRRAAKPRRLVAGTNLDDAKGQGRANCNISNVQGPKYKLCLGQFGTGYWAPPTFFIKKPVAPAKSRSSGTNTTHAFVKFCLVHESHPHTSTQKKWDLSIDIKRLRLLLWSPLSRP